VDIAVVVEVAESHGRVEVNARRVVDSEGSLEGSISVGNADGELTVSAGGVAGDFVLNEVGDAVVVEVDGIDLMRGGAGAVGGVDEDVVGAVTTE
jgi:hypothetical protein